MKKIDNLKIGEKVAIRFWEDMAEEFGCDDEYINIPGITFTKDMGQYCRRKVTIDAIVPNYNEVPYYKIKEDFGCYVWSEEIFEGKKKIMTNRQWLENLDDEELADFLLKSITNCPKICSSPECGIAYKCIDGVKMWLQSKHEE